MPESHSARIIYGYTFTFHDAVNGYYLVTEVEGAVIANLSIGGEFTIGHNEDVIPMTTFITIPFILTFLF
jgi:hypothetical protein